MKAITMGAIVRGLKLDTLIKPIRDYSPEVSYHASNNRLSYEGYEDDTVISYVSSLETGNKVIGVFNKRELTFKVIPYDENDSADSINDWISQEAYDWFVRQQQRAENVTGYFIPEAVCSPSMGALFYAIKNGKILNKLVYEGKTYEEIIAFLDSISVSVDDNNRYFDTWAAIEDDSVPENFHHSDDLPDYIYTKDTKKQRKIFWKWYKRLHKIWSDDTVGSYDDGFIYAYFSKFINQATLNECIHIIEMYDPQESNGLIRYGIRDAYRTVAGGMSDPNEPLVNALINRVCFRASERIKQLIAEDLDTMSEGYYKYVKEQLQHTDIELPKFKMVINHKCLGDKAPKQNFNKELKRAR